MISWKNRFLRISENCDYKTLYRYFVCMLLTLLYICFYLWFVMHCWYMLWPYTICKLEIRVFSVLSPRLFECTNSKSTITKTVLLLILNYIFVSNKHVHKKQAVISSILEKYLMERFSKKLITMITELNSN